MSFARDIASTLNSLPLISSTNSTFVESLPGADADIEELAALTSYGHHASCTCAIGADDDPMAVLDGQFRVRGTKGLRVVDASAFPRIPGW